MLYRLEIDFQLINNFSNNQFYVYSRSTEIDDKKNIEKLYATYNGEFNVVFTV